MQLRAGAWLAPYCHEMTDDDDPNTRCANCGYEWMYSGYGEPKPVATCPECGSKTPTDNIDTEEANA